MRLETVVKISGIWRAALIAVIGVGTLSVGAAAKQEADATPSGLELEIAIHKQAVDAETDVPVEWRLVNRGAASVTVCTWPGIAFSGGWFLADESFEGFGPGYPDKPELSLLDFRTLKSGEAITGSAKVAAYPTTAGYIRYRATFRSGDRGGDLKLSAWKGEVDSNVIEVTVPREKR